MESLIELLKKEEEGTLRRIVSDYLGREGKRLLALLQTRNTKVKSEVEASIGVDSETLIATIIDLLKYEGVVWDVEWQLVKAKLRTELGAYKAAGADMNFNINGWEASPETDQP